MIYEIRSVMPISKDVKNMILQVVQNVMLIMIFKMKNVIYILMAVIHIILQEIAQIVKVGMNYMIQNAILKLMDANNIII